MRILSFILILSIFFSCKTEVTLNYDNTPIKISSPKALSVLTEQSEINWTESQRSDYIYSMIFTPISSSDPSMVIDAIMDEKTQVKKGMQENFQKGFESLIAGQYYVLLVAKYPNTHSFSDFIESVPEDELKNYYDMRYYTTEGELPIGDGCGACCDTGSYTCKDGTVYQCVCSGEFCFRKLCIEKQELKLLEL